ncbi:hypothetical protein BU16DRAFT_463044 [Lophium mytilinum]|uniref:Uncharacterized protein n=1 Tax=Lophium mytilinum TaxID=390894 RepID=A0A6A6QQK8_9PEZI|nr:hypothetical protein BU16DRAFT_463044 [Lophium mytilinum]
MPGQLAISPLFGAPAGSREDVSKSSIPSRSPTSSEKTCPEAPLSLFEAVVTAFPPVLESLLSQLPTTSIFDLYHTSPHLREFLQSYPLAWKTLSFRLPQPPNQAIATPGNETPDGRERQSKTYALDALLMEVVVPFGTRLRNLDLCNTAVSGVALIAKVLQPRIETLQHLSVRGCKNVSIKYHIVPFLEPYTQKDSPWAKRGDLALKSLYAYRCRHHRRRPYLPSSLGRRDSDSDPTHQLIEICHKLGIWTDTAWCPTPGGRCFRRKDYHNGRGGPGNTEVWVPFDRLWRSSNRIGPADESAPVGHSDGRLWELCEDGQDGEPLGPEKGPPGKEGKDVPAHLRRSHQLFVDDLKCSRCHDPIHERCEQCSVRMHCMGCRKTLCASCAFNRPVPRKRTKTRHTNIMLGTIAPMTSIFSSSSTLDDVKEQSSKERFWWAPGTVRSPNLMHEPAGDDDSDSDDGILNHINNGMGPAPIAPPKLNMHWCCMEPVFSGGGGIAFVGPGLAGKGADKIRAAPLPRIKKYEDPDFTYQLRSFDPLRDLKQSGLYTHLLNEDLNVIEYLKQDSLDLQASTCPRGLCQECYQSFRWKVSCKACKSPLCKEHDFRALKIRKCGYRDLHVERDYVRNHKELPQFIIPPFRSAAPSSNKAEEIIDDNESFTSGEAMSINATDLDIEPVVSGSLSQSQILPPNPISLAPAAPPAMSASTSAHSHQSTTPNDIPFTVHVSVPVTPSRPRSLSASNSRSRSAALWPHSPRPVASTLINMIPRPGNPRHPVQWEGCGSYYCPATRHLGDNRPRCQELIRECEDCRVLVCSTCASANPECTCSFCSVHYFCPHCNGKPEIQTQCVLEEELEVARVKEVKMKERLVREKEQRAVADKLAETLLEFWEGLLGDVAAETFSETSETTSSPETTSNFIPEGSPDFSIPAVSASSSPSATEETSGDVVEPPPVGQPSIAVPVLEDGVADDETEAATLEVLDELISNGELVLM